jgi:hypothetical protein
MGGYLPLGPSPQVLVENVEKGKLFKSKIPRIFRSNTFGGWKQDSICVQSYIAQKLKPLSDKPLYYEQGLNENKECFIFFSKKYFLLQPSLRHESKFSTDGNKSKYFFCYNNEEI